MSSSGYFDALPSGYSLYEYRIDSVLGQGGFGITYKAHDSHLSKWVAIKEFLPESFAGREGPDLVRPRPGAENDFKWGLERFEREAQLLAQFEHPNIVPVLRRFAANGTIYMVMGYQEGESLDRILDATPRLEESELEEILYPLLSGLDEVHGVGVLHRDIKPENIFIRLADGSPVLLDFGAARAAIGQRGKSVTRIVTPNYAPYEQYYSEGRLGPWTDLYALAAVMYEGVAGEPPPEAPARVAKDTIKRATDAGEGRYRPEFLAAIDWALAFAPEDRPQTVADWRNALPSPIDPALATATGAAAPAPLREATTRLANAAATAQHRREKRKQKIPKRPAAGSAAVATHREHPAAAPLPGRKAKRAAKKAKRQEEAAPARWAAALAILLILGGLGVTGAYLASAPDNNDVGQSARLGVSPPKAGAGDNGADGEVKDGKEGEDNEEEAKRKAEEKRRQAAARARQERRRRFMVRVFADRRLTTRLPGRRTLTLMTFNRGGDKGGTLTAVTTLSDETGEEITERGRWVARGNRLCIRLTRWNDGARACFRVSMVTSNPARVPVTASGSAGRFTGTLVRQ
jgi:hypothetical protein